MCIEKIKFKKAKILIIAEDSSDNTKEKFTRICKENNIKIYQYGTSFELSRSIGKNNKTVVAVLDENFAKSICKMFDDLKEAIT